MIGRYFAMDRDKRWDRTQKALDLLLEGKGEHHADTAEEAAKAAYERDETDEFIAATMVGDEDATIRPGDSVIAFNFRPDRMRQITRKLTETVDRYATMAEYDEHWDFPVLFPPARPKITIAQVIAERGEKQLHVAETEKYAHVTYFFNGGEEDPYDGEIRELVPSPRDVPTYDKKPEMSAREAADAFVEPLEGRRAGVRDHQLRQSGHGRPHRRDRGGRDGGRDRRRVSGSRRGGRARERRRARDHRRPRQLRPHARGRRLGQHGALA